MHYQGRQLAPDEDSELHESIKIVSSGPSIHAVLRQNDVYLCRKVIDSEIASLSHHWVFCSAVDGGGAMPTKFILVKKQNDRGEVEGYKVRIIAQGFLQGLGFELDAEFTYTPTVNFSVLG